MLHIINKCKKSKIVVYIFNHLTTDYCIKTYHIKPVYFLCFSGSLQKILKVDLIIMKKIVKNLLGHCLRQVIAMLLMLVHRLLK